MGGTGDDPEQTRRTIINSTRKLAAKWNMESIKDLKSLVRKSMTEEEEADEIIKRLQRGIQPAPETIADELMKTLADEIAREIDAEILRELTRRTGP